MTKFCLLSRYFFVNSHQPNICTQFGIFSLSICPLRTLQRCFYFRVNFKSKILSYTNYVSAIRNCLFLSNAHLIKSNIDFSLANRLMFPFSVATSVKILFNAILFNDTWSITSWQATHKGRSTRNTIKSD